MGTCPSHELLDSFIGHCNCLSVCLSVCLSLCQQQILKMAHSSLICQNFGLDFEKMREKSYATVSDSIWPHPFIPLNYVHLNHVHSR